MKLRLSDSSNVIKKALILHTILILIVAVILFIAFFLLSFRPVFEDKAKSAARSKANGIINSAVYEAVKGIESEEFVKINTDASGNISSLNTDTIMLNTVRTRIYKYMEAYAKDNESKIYIPLGSLTENPFLQGVGYRLPIKIIFDPSVKIDFYDDLEKKGINEIYHRVYIKVSMSMDINSVAITTSEKVDAEIPICQTVLMGAVPESYWVTDEND